MKRDVRFTAVAEEDLRQARRWYAEQALSQVGAAFRSEISATLTRLEKNAEAYPEIY